MKILIVLFWIFLTGGVSAQSYTLKADSIIALPLTINYVMKADYKSVPQNLTHNQYNEPGYRKNKTVIIAVIIGVLVLIAILK